MQSWPSAKPTPKPNGPTGFLTRCSLLESVQSPNWQRCPDRGQRKFVYEKPTIMNAEFVKKALEKVGNPNVLVNLISRRVRQLSSGGGAMSHSLVADIGHLGFADIALLEIIEEKMGWEMPEPAELTRPASKKRKKR